jgi:hypothetical protein
LYICLHYTYEREHVVHLLQIDDHKLSYIVWTVNSNI